MQTIIKLFKTLWAAWYMLIFSVYLIISYPLILILLSQPRWYKQVNLWRKSWAYFITLFTGVNYEIVEELSFDKNTPVIYCANHSSIIDIPFFGTYCAPLYKFMAKIEFMHIPIFGIFFRTIDIAVDRHNKLNAFKSYKKAVQAIDEGYSLIIFPEGTAEKNPPELLPFKNGPFKIAIEKKIPIVPITFLDNWRLFLWHGDFSGYPGTSRVIVHQPIITQHLSEKDVEFLKTKTFQIIYQALSKEYGSKQSISR